MSETRPPFEPTLPEGATLDDLNKAHMADKNDGGNREEALYPTAQVHFDNAEAYRQEMAVAQTPEQLADLKTRLEPTPPSEQNPEGKSEFAVYTGGDTQTEQSLEKRMAKKEQDLAQQEEMVSSLLNNIQAATTVNDIKKLEYRFQILLAEHTITPRQYERLTEATQARKGEIQVAYTGELSRQIGLINAFSELTNQRNHILEDKAMGRISSEQLAQLESELETKRQQLQEAHAELLLRLITSSEHVRHVENMIYTAEYDTRHGLLNPTLLEQLKTEAKKVRQEIEEREAREREQTQKENYDNFLSLVNAADTYGRLTRELPYIFTEALTNEEITREQLLELQTATTARINEITAHKVAEAIGVIATLSTVGEVEDWIDYTDDMTLGTMTPEQKLKVMSAARNRKAEIEEGVA